MNGSIWVVLYLKQVKSKSLAKKESVEYVEFIFIQIFYLIILIRKNGQKVFVGQPGLF
jgi:hypothetical protein